MSEQPLPQIGVRHVLHGPIFRCACTSAHYPHATPNAVRSICPGRPRPPHVQFSIICNEDDSGEHGYIVWQRTT
jgi:hypothetical protein